MDCLAQIISEKYSNPIEFLKQLRQTTEPIGGGMEYCDNGEYVEYDVAVEAVKKAQKQLIDETCEWIKDNVNYYMDWYDFGKCMLNKGELIEDFRKAMKGE